MIEFVVLGGNAIELSVLEGKARRLPPCGCHSGCSCISALEKREDPLKKQNLKKQISMSIWLQVVLVMHILVTHLGQILVVIDIPRSRPTNTYQHE